MTNYVDPYATANGWSAAMQQYSSPYPTGQTITATSGTEASYAADQTRELIKNFREQQSQNRHLAEDLAVTRRILDVITTLHPDAVAEARRGVEAVMQLEKYMAPMPTSLNSSANAIMGVVAATNMAAV